jgi:hypothetical protein
MPMPSLSLSPKVVETETEGLAAIMRRMEIERRYGLREINHLKRLTRTILGGSWKLRVFVPGYSDELRRACVEMIKTIDELEANAPGQTGRRRWHE